jgi:hypothetical protein
VGTDFCFSLEAGLIPKTCPAFPAANPHSYPTAFSGSVIHRWIKNQLSVDCFVFVNCSCKQINTVYYARPVSVDKPENPFFFSCLRGG